MKCNTFLLNQSIRNMQQELYCSMMLTIDKELIADRSLFAVYRIFIGLKRYYIARPFIGILCIQ